MKKPLIYLSGPMSDIDDLNRPLFNATARRLRDKGYRVINPPELDYVSPKKTWADCLKRDLAYVVRCDAVATLPNWRKSRGANLEVYVARAVFIPVAPVKKFLIKKFHGRKA